MNKLKIVLFFLIALETGFVLAAEPKHGRIQTPEMRRQHDAMSILNKQWAALKRHLAADDVAAAGPRLVQMQKAARYLEKFKLHKNAERMEEFLEQARSFQEGLTKLGKSIKGKDKAEAQGLSTAIDKSCGQCHSIFR